MLHTYSDVMSEKMQLRGCCLIERRPAARQIEVPYGEFGLLPQTATALRGVGRIDECCVENSTLSVFPGDTTQVDRIELNALVEQDLTLLDVSDFGDLSTLHPTGEVWCSTFTPVFHFHFRCLPSAALQGG